MTTEGFLGVENALDWYRIWAAFWCFVVVGSALRVVLIYERWKQNSRRWHVMMVGTAAIILYAGAGTGELLLLGKELDASAWFIATFLSVSAILMTTGLYLILRSVRR